jgi:Leucine-rich repeat (LRR) protein
MAYAPVQWQSTTIANTAVNSAAIDLGRVFDKIQLDLPAMNATSINIAVSRTAGGTYNFLGNEALVDVSTGSSQRVFNIHGYQYLKVICNNAQGALRTIYYRPIAD